jgi:L,D-transpeptidase catalytic domain
MPLRSFLSSMTVAGVAALLLTTPTPAKAQGLFDLLWGGNSEWGGTSEWGGDRQTISFDPQFTSGQIIVSFGDRRLYLITRKGEAISYPIAVPREQSRWEGKTTVTDKRVNPSWRPTPDMIKENPKLPNWVPGGHPMNPLGVRAMYLGASTYRIHGTDAPWTIGQAVSKGCIRMYNKDVLDLYPRVPVGTKVTVTWERFSDKTAVVANYDDASSSSNASNDSTSEKLTGAEASRRVIRNLAPLPRKPEAAETETSALPDDFVQIDENGARIRPAKKAAKEIESDSKPVAKKADTADKKTVSKAAEKSEAASKAETDKKSDTASKPDTASKTETPAKADPVKTVSKIEEPAEQAKPVSSAASAAESAQRAAEAASRAAVAARAAASVAREAADAAKKATSVSDPDKPEKAATGKSAAL